MKIIIRIYRRYASINSRAVVIKVKRYLEGYKIKTEKGYDFFKPLNERETKMLELILAGHPNKTVNTVKTHIRNIY